MRIEKCKLKEELLLASSVEQTSEVYSTVLISSSVLNLSLSLVTDLWSILK